MRRLIVILMMLAALALAACAAPPTNGPVQGSPQGESAEPAQPAQPALPTQPAPTTPAPVSPAPRGDTAVVGEPAQIDSSCKVDADCTVKNVGNCCGYYPACVNVNSPTNPEAVQAECARTGMASVCGFREISSCSCVSGQCQAQSADLNEVLR